MDRDRDAGASDPGAASPEGTPEPPAPGVAEDEPLTQEELRRRLEESVAQEKARRTESEKEEDSDPEPEEPEEEPEWEPPEEAVQRGGWPKILVRVAVFALILVGLWSLLQQASLTLFDPEFAALDPVVPEGRSAPGDPVEAGVRMANVSLFEGDAFVVAVFRSGREIQGPDVTIPGRDTALVPVTLDLEEGDHIFSLVAFSSGEEPTRLASFPGQSLWVGSREVELRTIELPSILEQSDVVPVSFLVMNPGSRPEQVVPVFSFERVDGVSTELAGPPAEVAPGQADSVRVTLVGDRLEPGSYTVRAFARTPDGLRLAHDATLSRVEVRP